MLAVVAHTDHDGGYLFQRRVSEHGDLVLRLVVGVVIDDVWDSVAYALVACAFGLVPGGLGVREHLERKIEHVLLWPYRFTVGGGVVVIQPRCGQMQRDLIFIVVIAQVGTETDEAGEVAVLQFGINALQFLGMDEHLQVLVLPHVVARVLVHRPCVMRTEVRYAEDHRLLVLGDKLRLTGVGLTAYTRRQHIVDRRAGAVFLYVDGLHIDGCAGVDCRSDRCQVACVHTPVATDEVQRGETQVGLFLETGEVHTHEADGFPVADGADLLHAGAVAAERDLELVPCHILGRSVAKRHFADLLLGDMLAAYLHHVGTEDDLVLVVFLVLVEGVVLVDIFYIRREGGGGTVALCLLLRGGRVALRTVEMFVSRQNRHFLFVIVGASVVMEIIAGGVVTRREAVIRPAVPYIGRDAALQFRKILAVCRPCQLLGSAQTVETHILTGAGAGFIAECYHGTRRLGDVTPDSRIYTTLVGIADRQTVLERFLAVTQNILAHIAEVEIQLAFISVGVGQCRVHQPELDVLDVRFLKIGVVQPPHDTAPTLLGVSQMSVCAYLGGGDVVLTALGRVVGEVQYR